MRGSDEGLLGLISMFSGGSLSQSTIFGLGIMPYISASIIFQLLASVYPPLEKLQKEGEAGRKKINEYTRYATVLICLFQAWIWVSHITEPQAGRRLGLAIPGYDSFFYVLTSIVTMTVGTVFLMWIGDARHRGRSGRPGPWRCRSSARRRSGGRPCPCPRTG